MRRILAVLVLCAAALVAAGCSQGTGGTGSSSTASATASASASASASGDVAANTKQVCADAKKVTEDATKKMTDELPKAIQSGSNGLSTVKQWFTDWSTGLRDQAAKAQDPDLKTALTDLADGLDEFNANIKTPSDLTKAGNVDTPKFKSAGEKLDKICGT